LRTFESAPIASKGINFAKDYKKDSYNTTKMMGKKLLG
jgi:hypothetical protein